MIYSQQTLFGTMQNVKTCPECNGTGKIIKDKCPDCNGKAYIQKKKSFEVDIPAGIDNGMSIRMAGGGEPGINGGPRGDLLVEAVVSPHPIFKRQDTNIFLNGAYKLCKGCTWRQYQSKDRRRCSGSGGKGRNSRQIQE